MPKSSQKKGGAKKEYTGTYRHFTLHEVNGKSVEIGTADIKDHQTPLNAAKKLLSSWCRHEGIKSNERNKVNITFTIRETTRGHSKVYGPYKGKFVKYDKPLMIKLKSGKVIKRIGKPMVKIAKGNNNKKMVGGNKIEVTLDELKEIIKYMQGGVSFNELRKLTNNEKEQLKSKKEELKKKYNGLSNLNVSGISDMSYLFANFDFNLSKQNGYTIDISDWNVNNVTNMKNMFDNSKGFNQDLSNWNISKVTDMTRMFYNCKDLDKSFSKWIINKNTATNDMFTGCTKYDKNMFN